MRLNHSCFFVAVRLFVWTTGTAVVASEDTAHAKMKDKSLHTSGILCGNSVLPPEREEDEGITRLLEESNPSPLPSSNPSPLPSSNPTESTMPSLTPSHTPTTAPSISLLPTIDPSSSADPTVTFEPSTTSTLSVEPSILPTATPTTPKVPETCGDQICEQEIGETCASCPQDCEAPEDCNELGFVVDSASILLLLAEGNFIDIQAVRDSTIYSLDILVVDPNVTATAKVFTTTGSASSLELNSEEWNMIYDGAVLTTLHPFGLGIASFPLRYPIRLPAGSVQGFYLQLDLYSQSLFSIGPSKRHGMSSNEDIVVSGTTENENSPGFSSLFIGTVKYWYGIDCYSDAACEDGNPYTIDYCVTDNNRCNNNFPSAHPTVSHPPSARPTNAPSTMPSSGPSSTPSLVPTDEPSSIPSITNSSEPTTTPTKNPTPSPTFMPTDSPVASVGLIESVITTIVNLPANVVGSIVAVIGGIFGGRVPDYLY